MMKAQLLKNKRNQWYFRFVASNGKILCHSESYSSRTMARRGMMSLINALESQNNRVEETEE